MPEMYRAKDQAGKDQFFDVPGWTPAVVTGALGEAVTVKSGPGLVARVNVPTAIDVTLRDGDTAVWPVINNADEDFGRSPVVCGDSIVLYFAAAGTAYILYR